MNLTQSRAMIQGTTALTLEGIVALLELWNAGAREVEYLLLFLFSNDQDFSSASRLTDL